MFCIGRAAVCESLDLEAIASDSDDHYTDDEELGSARAYYPYFYYLYLSLVLVVCAFNTVTTTRPRDDETPSIANG
jgi:hypothetical protein